MSTAKEIASIYLRQKREKLNKQREILDKAFDQLSESFLDNGKVSSTVTYPLDIAIFKTLKTSKAQYPTYDFGIQEKTSYSQSEGWETKDAEFTVTKTIYCIDVPDTYDMTITGEYSGKLEDYNKWLNGKHQTLDFKLTLKV